MKIICTETEWEVIAEWYGAERVIHRGDLYDCCRWVRDHG